jgi:hypothetical protein
MIARSWAMARSLSIALLVLYLATQLFAAISLWFELVEEQRQHGLTLDLGGPDGYAWTFLEQTLQNWQSEFLALAVIVALSAKLIHRGSRHSRDSQDEVQQRVQAIERRVKAL